MMLAPVVMILVVGILPVPQDPRSFPSPAELKSVESSADGSSLALVHANGKAVSVLSTATGEIRKVAQEFTSVEGVALVGARLLVAENGVVGMYDLATLQLRGSLKTAAPGITAFLAVPNQDDRVYSVALVTKLSAKVHVLDLKQGTARPATILGEFIPTVGPRLIPVSGTGEYLLTGSSTVSRVLLQDDRIVVVEGPVAVHWPGVVELDDARGQVFIGGKGLAAITDLSTVFQRPPQAVVAPSWVTCAASPSLLVRFDGIHVRLADAWSGAEIKEELVSPVRAAGMHRVVAPPLGKRVFAITAEKIYEVPLGDAKGKVPEGAVGRFKGVPKTIQVAPDQKFSFKPTAAGLGKKVSYFMRSGPKDLTVDAKTGEIRWTVPKDFSRSVTVQVGAKDEKDLEASLHFRLWTASPKDLEPERIPVNCNIGVPTEPVTNPEYRAWSRCAPGSWVTTLTSNSRGSQITFKITMEKLNPDRVELKTEGTMPLEGNMVQRITIADGRKAKFEPHEIPRMVNEGTETLQIAGKKIACIWRETIQEHDGRRTSFKTWWSDEVPGGIVKQINGADEPFGGTVTLLTGWEKK